MAAQPPSPPTFSIMGIEAGLTVLAVAASFAWPRFAGKLFARLRRHFAALARKRSLALLVVGLATLLIRLAVLPVHPIPMPFAPDDFSNLLAADTFLHGRLANPTPAMWVHFETIHVDMLPTYASMYFPAQGLLMAAGKLLFGHPWFGILISGAFMCSAVTWMLQGWLPPAWAVLGGLLLMMRIALFSYWTSTYHTAGPICAIGGALVLGALPRFKRSPHARYLLAMAAGAVILAISRPYEGLLLCLPVLVALAHWLIRTRRLSMRTLLLRASPALVVLIAGLAWLGYYDYKAFGSPLTLPYTVNRATYAMATYYVWQDPRPEPHYRHAEMRRFYTVDELEDYNRNHSISGFFFMTTVKAVRAVYFFTGVALIPPLFLLPWALRDRRIRFLVISLCVLAVGMAIEIFLIPHYVAPFTAAFYAVGLQAMRHLYHCKPAGRAIAHSVVAICVLLALLRPFNRQLGCPIPEKPVSTWIVSWFGPDHFVTDRSFVERQLQQQPGPQLAIVRYAPDHDPLDEWVYNQADINASEIIWARAMDPASDAELIRYYPNRTVWLVQPDSIQNRLLPYPLAQQVTAVPLR
ncbi:hypothetical protein [Occallatibacter savannae]|uniref:hypothetical protein n=1 Tax=Occallatibacter savannae TaxID=1002691 RepID=UPI0013A54BFF|nr:hypothetical protein [Occallatibacter savannae]